MARKVYEGDLDNGIDSDFYIKMGEEFKKGLDEGFPIDFDKIEYNSTDLLARQKLASNIYGFSGAKTFSQILEMKSLLVDDKGNLRSFSDFKADALKLNEKYNLNWLNTEYNNAVNSSISAANWQRHTENKDIFPYLVYQTVGDSNVRDEHQRLDNIKLPVNDAFWNTHYPPNDWGCRCDVVNDNDDSDLTDPNEAKERSSGAIRNKMFKNNPGKTGLIFKDSHPYFKSSNDHPTSFKAVENYGLRTIEKIYSKPSKLSKPIQEFKNKDEFKDWYENKKKGSAGIENGFVLSKNVIDNKLVFDDVLKTKLLKGDGHKIAGAVDQFISSADEVYSISEKSGLKTIYIKYYQDKPVIVTTEINKGLTRIQSIDALLPDKSFDKLRKGILMFKK